MLCFDVQVRLIEAAVKAPGWGVPEDVLKLLPGQAFEVEQSLDDKGLPCEKPVSDKKKASEHRCCWEGMKIIIWESLPALLIHMLTSVLLILQPAGS